MKKTTQKALRNLVAEGKATDLTHKDVIEGLTVIAVSRGIYGINGLLMQDPHGNQYAITKRTIEIDYYF